MPFDKKPARDRGRRHQRPRSKGGDVSSVSSAWDELSAWTFGPEWGWSPEDRANLAALIQLRNDTIHSVGGLEQVVPAPNEPNEHILFFADRGVELRPEPGCWADRVLTPDVAQWAVDTATAQIAAVRKAYQELQFRAAMDEHMSANDEDGPATWPDEAYG